MDENSETMPIIPENEPTIPENEPTIPQKEQEPPPQPKARGRPKGVKDAKPRIKRVPIQQEEAEPPPQVKKVKKVEVRPEERPAPKREEPPAEEVDEEEGEEAPLPRQSRQEHCTASACNKRPRRGSSWRGTGKTASNASLTISWASKWRTDYLNRLPATRSNSSEMLCAAACS